VHGVAQFQTFGIMKWRTRIAIGIVTVILYILSIGPVARILYIDPRDDNSHELTELCLRGMDIFYAPLDWMGKLFSPADRTLKWYISVWIPAETPNVP